MDSDPRNVPPVEESAALVGFNVDVRTAYPQHASQYKQIESPSNIHTSIRLLDLIACHNSDHQNDPTFGHPLFNGSGDFDAIAIFSLCARRPCLSMGSISTGAG